jgi:predicted ester cyclase
MSGEEHKAVLRRLAQALNSCDLDGVDEVFAPDYVRHDPSDLLHDAGVEEYKEAFSGVLRAFPDAHWAIEELLADGDRVIERFSFRGTHTGPFFNLASTGRVALFSGQGTHQGEFMGIPATGRVADMPGIGRFRIAGGRIAEIWSAADITRLMQQLGAMSPQEGGE